MGHLKITLHKGESIRLDHPAGLVIVDIAEATSQVSVWVNAPESIRVERCNNRVKDNTKEAMNAESR